MFLRKHGYHGNWLVQRGSDNYAAEFVWIIVEHLPNALLCL